LDVRVLGPNRPYEEVLELQRSIHRNVAAGDCPDTVLLLEHSAVFTAGRRTEWFERPMDGTPVVDVDRGGKITWHGPGQLVGYPIVRLPIPGEIIAYVRRVERMLIGLVESLGVPAQRVPGRTGVWTHPDQRGAPRKLAAIGIRVSEGVTMHGFALNCDCDLSPFGVIVPCGLADAEVTSLTIEAGRRVTPVEAGQALAPMLGAIVGA
jgi:lipoyl(octanoyl) transferase